MLPDVLRGVETAAAIEAWDAGALLGGSQDLGETVLFIEPGRIVGVCRLLKTQHGFNRLSAVTAIDRYPAEPRFEVVYLLHAAPAAKRLRLKCRLSGADPAIESVTSVWEGANWYERETFDLFGIRFLNHPNLTRIMLPEYWEGHPLRKDFPIDGYRYGYAEKERAE
jgi:NADH-quinone oxidoreductase subunit C